MQQRVTDSELGAIRHRPETLLTEPRRCSRGHLAPYYKSINACSVCQKANTYELLAVKGRSASRQYMRKWSDYRAALEHKLEGGLYGTTDNERVVRRLRGGAWVRRCDDLQCWDEVAIAAHVGQERRA
jgi:hypothetical protein